MYYVFDVKLQAALRIKADSAEVALKQLIETMECADANFGHDWSGDPITGEASLISVEATVNAGDEEPIDVNVPPGLQTCCHCRQR